MASMKDSQLVEKLNQHNYANWSFKMKMLLIKEELSEMIIQEQPNPVTTEWTKRDNKARALINLSIDDSQIIYVKNLSTARETWNSLKGIHERSNLSSKLYLLRKLYSSKLDEKGNMNTHITKILENVDRLKAIGEEIKDSHIAALFLCSLPPSYETLITALEARPEDELTSEFISNKLKDEYNRRRETNASAENASKAFQTSNKREFNYNNYNYKRENKFCTYCKRKSHYKSECYHLKNKNNNTFKNKNNQFKPKPNNTSSLCFETQKPDGNDELCLTHSDEVEATASTKNNLAFLTENSENRVWIIDSGSSSHIANNKELFNRINEDEHSEVIIANGGKLISYGSGEVVLETQTSQGETNTITLKNVLYVPELESNLLSVRKATQSGCKIIFENEKCKLEFNGKTFLEGKLKNNLYEVILKETETKHKANIAYQCNSENCIQLWHRRTGHKNYAALKELVNKQLATGITINSCDHENTCETCVKAKLADMPYPKRAQNRATKILQLVHSDVCGPMPVPTIGGKTYFLTLTDDFSRYTVIYLLTKKHEVTSKIKEYISFTTNKFGKKPQAIRSDNGGEFVNKELESFLKEMGIQHQTSVPHCPAQNGVAERKNRTLVEMTRSMLSDTNLDKKFWGEALNTANYLVNRLPTKSHTKTPFEMWTNKKPNLAHLKIFGCKAYAYIDKTKRNKLDDKALEGIFVGYDDHSKAYRIYNEGKNVIISRTVKFFENTTPNPNFEAIEKASEKDNTQSPETEEKIDTIEIELGIPQEIEPVDADNSEIATDQPRRSQRSNIGVPPDRLIYLTKQTKVHEPKSYEEVLNIENPEDRGNWLKAMEEEVKSLKENKTWTLVTAPAGRKVIGSKWTYKIKQNSKGETEKFKARLCAKGFTQKFGEDFYETFAPVVSYTTIRTLLAASAHKNLNVHHIDVKTAFLHGDLEEVVYMTQPEGYINPGDEQKVCRLNKAIYGLKQAARAWHIKIGESLRKANFIQSTSDPCLFKKDVEENKIYVIVYVDDILIAAKPKQINDTIEYLAKEYEIKDLGEVSYYLGINIQKTKDGNYTLNQNRKIEELVNKFNMQHSKPYNTPMESGYLKLEDEENPLPNNTNYRQAVGALLYIATISRPDITAAVNIVSRRNERPRQKDWNAVKRIISYLNATINLNLVISAHEKPTLTVYADADWAGDKTDRKSTSGNLFMLGNSPIQWTSKKQKSVALSSAEAEYISAAYAVQEILWLLNLLSDFDLQQNLPIKLYDDNQSCIKMIDSPKYMSRSKHIDIKFHCIRNLKEEGTIDLHYCPTKHMLADILTKPLPKQDFVKHRNNLQLYPDDVSEIKEKCWSM